MPTLGAWIAISAVTLSFVICVIADRRDNSEKFIRNEINVLLTRGVNGLYIYAVDEALRNALKRALPET